MDRNCKNNPNRFCYICSNVFLPKRQAKITDFVKTAYRDYFGVKLADQDEQFAPPRLLQNMCGELDGLEEW